MIRRSTVRGDPMDAAIGVMWVSFLVYLPFSIFYSLSSVLTVKSILAFFAAGAFGSFLAVICLYFGIKIVGASQTSPVLKGDLLVASIVGVFLLGETVTAGHLAGILLLVVGLVIVSREMESDDSATDWSPKIDLFFPIGAMVFSGLARPFAKIGLSEGTPVFLGLGIKFSAGLGLLILYFLIRGRSPFAPFKSAERKSYILTGFAVAIGMLLFYLALRVSRVVVVMPFWSLTPLFVLIFSYLYLKKLERITKGLVLGTVTVIIGAILTGIFM